ncbi:MAG: DNA repair protein RadC [Bacteroidota bacterium]
MSRGSYTEENDGPGIRRGSIRTWPSDERPREKLLQHGPSVLTDAELLAILLRTGSGTESAVDLSRGLLAREGGLQGIARRNVDELTRCTGIGAVKAAGIMAAVEIGRRLQREGNSGKTFVRSPEDAARLLIPRLRDLRHEAFIVLVLDSNNGVVADVELSRGTLNASVVHPREVFKLAIDRLGAAVIVAHNHPSGNPEPSREDLEITRQLAEAGRIVGIPLHDHLVIAGNGFTSLASRGHL